MPLPRFSGAWRCISEWSFRRQQSLIAQPPLKNVKGLRAFLTLTNGEDVAAYQKVWEEKTWRPSFRRTNGAVFNELPGTYAVLVTEGKPGTGKTLALPFQRGLGGSLNGNRDRSI